MSNEPVFEKPQFTYQTANWVTHRNFMAYLDKTVKFKITNFNPNKQKPMEFADYHGNKLVASWQHNGEYYPEDDDFDQFNIVATASTPVFSLLEKKLVNISYHLSYPLKKD